MNDVPAAPPSPRARAVADRAVAAWFDAVVDTLADLVAFRTVVESGVPNARNPEFLRLKAYLADVAARLGLDFEDHGAALVLGLGRSPDRLGLLTHADVRPADEAAWTTDPFTLDRDAEPGRLLGRGVEDDKAAIAAALYSLKALRDAGLPARRRVELIVSLAEESDWTPFREFLAGWTPPPLNIAFDALYPVVTGESGAGAIRVTLRDDPAASGPAPQPPGSNTRNRPVAAGPARTAPHPPGSNTGSRMRGDPVASGPAPPRPGSNTGSRPAAAGPARIVSFVGGSYLSQVPARAEALVAGADARLASALRRDAARAPAGRIEVEPRDGALRIRSRGVAAHSSAPWAGRNAIVQLAALLDRYPWPPTAAASLVRFANDLVGPGHHAERFGDLAYAHEVMGRLTLTLATVAPAEGGGLVAGLNVRRPAGRTSREVEKTVRAALDDWGRRSGRRFECTVEVGEPYYLESAPHVPVLLGVFRHYTGQHAAGPISVGGGTQARLLPNGVNFGPAMPDEPYTGHSDHEFMTVDRLRLNLRMCTAALVDLAG